MLLLAASGLALTLGGCKVDNRPFLTQLSDRPAADQALPQPGTPYDTAAYAGNLPPPPPPLPPARAYPYAERAYGLDRAFYEVPPDYGFAYGDEQPWVWEAADDSLMFGEPYGDDYRFYYYEPGVDYPYFVRDANYGYAYGDNGALLAVFSAAGALLSASDYPRDYPRAADYWRRGSELRTAYLRAPRAAIDPGVWTQRAPRIQRIEQPWMAAPQRQPAWREWRASAPPAAIRRFEAQRPARAPEQRVDNGLHLGWERGRHEGWNRGQAAAPAPRAFAAAPQVHAEPRRVESRPAVARQDRGPRFEARAAEAHGRDAAFEGAPHVQPQPQPAPQERGRHGGGPRFAEAQPQPHAAPQGGGWHGGGRENHAQAQAQAQPQPQPQAQQQQHQGGGQHPNGHQGNGQDKKHGG